MRDFSEYKVALADAEAWNAFHARYGAVVTSALDLYRDEKRKAAAEAQAAYDAIKDDPAACAAQDKSIVTANGLVQIARRWTESADKAERAIVEYLSLTEPDADDEEGDNEGDDEEEKGFSHA